MFEHPFGAALTVVESVAVEDPAGISPPSHIIQLDDAWQLRVKWSLSGPAAPFLGGVQYVVSAYAEHIGGGFEGQVGPTMNVPGSFVAPFDYEALILVPAGTDPGGLLVGAYKLTVLITTDIGGVPQEFAGFVSGPLIQVYQSV